MNLGEIRQLFIDRSGRHDLVVDPSTGDYTDNGANAYINSAQKYLDKKVNIVNSEARLFKKIASGTHGIVFQNSRIIREVWCANTTSRWWLEKADYSELRGKPDLEALREVAGFTSPPGSLDTGPPLAYAQAKIRVTPEPGTLTMEDLGLIGSYGDVVLGDYKTYNGIIFLPPADGEYMIEVVGNFHQPNLSTDSDTSVWTELYSDLLLMATMRQLEIFYRNTEGVRDWNNVIADELIDIDFDIVEQESIGSSQMEG